MRKLLTCLAVLLLFGRPIRAQNPFIDSGSITAVSSGGACAAAPAGCAVFAPLPNGLLNSVTLQVSGTFTATLLFEATSDGTNWQTITGIKLSDGSSATGATATGQFAFQNTGLTGLRVRCTAFTSGTAVVTAVRGYAAARWLTPFFTSVTSAGDVTAGATGAFAWTGLSRITSPSDGVILLTNAAGSDFTRLDVGGTTSSFPALGHTGTVLQAKLADNSTFAGFGAFDYRLGSVVWNSSTAPSAPSSCGTSPAVTTANGTAAWVVTGGTGGTATGCVVTMPAATTGWNCSINNLTGSAAHRADRTTVQTASTTTSVTWEYQVVSTGAAVAFTASDVFRGLCAAY